MARKAYKQNMTGEGYMWMIVGWMGIGWYLTEDAAISCSQADMKLAVESSLYIATEFEILSTSEEPGISGMVIIIPHLLRANF